MNPWIEATRPKTLIAALSPVGIGTLLAIDAGYWSLSICITTLLFALCIQIGTNFANDYIDFLKGTDTPQRKGPRRLVQSGCISVKKMRQITAITFTIAACLGIYLTSIGGWTIGLLSLAAIACGYLYTGGPFPLGYVGLGDLFVLIFFGPVAVAGTTYLQTGVISPLALTVGWAPGLFSTAMIAMNNMRDVEEDRKTNKKTLAVRFGIPYVKGETALCLILPSLIALYTGVTTSHPWTAIAAVSLVFTLPLALKIIRSPSTSLSPFFPKIGQVFILYTLLFIGGFSL